MSSDWLGVAHDTAEIRRLQELAAMRGGQKAAWDAGDSWARVCSDSVQRHFEGLMGECAVAKLFGLSVDQRHLREGDGNAPDMILPFAKPIPVAVKTRGKKNWDFALRGMDPAEFGTGIGVLVWLDPDHPNRVIVPGFLRRKEFDTHCEPKNYLGRVGADRLTVPPERLQPLLPLVLKLNRYRMRRNLLAKRGEAQ